MGFISFLPLKTLDFVLECLKFSSVCLMIAKILGLLGLAKNIMAVIILGIISCAPFSVGFLSSFNGICKALFMLFSIKAIG